MEIGERIVSVDPRKKLRWAGGLRCVRLILLEVCFFTKTGIFERDDPVQILHVKIDRLKTGGSPHDRRKFGNREG